MICITVVLAAFNPGISAASLTLARTLKTDFQASSFVDPRPGELGVRALDFANLLWTCCLNICSVVGDAVGVTGSEGKEQRDLCRNKSHAVFICGRGPRPEIGKRKRSPHILPFHP
jgi:hypothetical protein